jgi:hypothetical protein
LPRGIAATASNDFGPRGGPKQVAEEMIVGIKQTTNKQTISSGAVFAI